MTYPSERPIKVERPDSETQYIYISMGRDGWKLISATNHDDHGWDGMAASLAAVQLLAEELGMKVIDRDDWRPISVTSRDGHGPDGIHAAPATVQLLAEELGMKVIGQ